MVFSRNGAVYSTKVEDYQLLPEAHAECRALRKMDYGGTLYVSRISKRDKSLVMARPCPMCQIKIRAKGVKKVFYSINEFQFGVWTVRSDSDKIYGV
jgi:deoxycytidylate deaminase